MSTKEFFEGEEAARLGLLFNACPYTFAACGYDYAVFDRAKLDSWWAGWAQHYMATIGRIPYAKNPPANDGGAAAPTAQLPHTEGASHAE